MMRILRVVLVAALILPSNSALAHEMTMAEMELRETAPGQFMWQWTGVGHGPPRQEVSPHKRQGGRADVGAVAGAGPVDAGSVRCGPQDLSGTLMMNGVGQTYSAVMVKVFWSDGGNRVYTFTTAQKAPQLYSSAEDKRGMG